MHFKFTAQKCGNSLSKKLSAKNFKISHFFFFFTHVLLEIKGYIKKPVFLEQSSLEKGFEISGVFSFLSSHCNQFKESQNFFFVRKLARLC